MDAGGLFSPDNPSDRQMESAKCRGRQVSTGPNHRTLTSANPHVPRPAPFEPDARTRAAGEAPPHAARNGDEKPTARDGRSPWLPEVDLIRHSVVEWRIRCAMHATRIRIPSPARVVRLIPTPSPCHSERSEESRSGFSVELRPRNLVQVSGQPSLRSFQSRFSDSINAIFFIRPHDLICFSRAMATTTSPEASK